MRDHTVHLIPHPATPCAAIRDFSVRVRWTSEGLLLLDYAIEGAGDWLALPDSAWARRVDGLWHHTCFEVFLTEPSQPGYYEANFSPSGEWAAYRFVAYREGMAAVAALRPPAIARRWREQVFELGVVLDIKTILPNPSTPRLAITAVIEDRNGGFSYWALTHLHDTPDFHHEGGFTLAMIG